MVREFGPIPQLHDAKRENVCLLTHITDVSQFHMCQGKCDAGVQTRPHNMELREQLQRCGRVDVSVCTHTLTHTLLLCLLEGKIQLLVCLGDLWGQCRHVQMQQKKKKSRFAISSRVFLLNSFKCSFLQRANKCMSWLQSLQSDVKRGTNNSL